MLLDSSSEGGMSKIHFGSFIIGDLFEKDWRSQIGSSSQGSSLDEAKSAAWLPRVALRAVSLFLRSVHRILEQLGSWDSGNPYLPFQSFQK